MKCLTCSTEMKRFDGIVRDCYRVDLLKCPKCGSKADVEFHPSENYIIEAVWQRRDDEN